MFKRTLGPGPWALALGPLVRALENAVTYPLLYFYTYFIPLYDQRIQNNNLLYKIHQQYQNAFEQHSKIRNISKSSKKIKYFNLLFFNL